MLEDVLNRFVSARTALSNRERMAISKWAGPAAAVEMTKRKAASYRALVNARERVGSAERASRTVETSLPPAERKLETHDGGQSIWTGILWVLLGLTALFGEGALNRISLPYILSIDPQSLDGWVLPISATLGPILLHCVFDALDKWGGRAAPLVRRIPVLVGAVLALWFVFDVASLRGQAIAFMLNPNRTETEVSPEQIDQTMKLLGVGIGWWAGTFFFLASRHFHGHSLARVVARLQQAASQAQEEVVAARIEHDIAKNSHECIDQAAFEEAVASLAAVSVEGASNEGKIGSGADEVNRRLAGEINANLTEMPVPELPSHSAWRKTA